jgi:hypothetical protein
MDIVRMNTATLTNARAVRKHNPSTPHIIGRKRNISRRILLWHRARLLYLWPLYFPKHDLATLRLTRDSLDSFERACDLAELEAAERPVSPKPRSRPTPQVTVEAIWHTIRERGLGALDEQANRQRLSDCDSAARAELQRRLDGLRRK